MLQKKHDDINYPCELLKFIELIVVVFSNIRYKIYDNKNTYIKIININEIPL